MPYRGDIVDQERKGCPEQERLKAEKEAIRKEAKKKLEALKAAAAELAELQTALNKAAAEAAAAAEAGAIAEAGAGTGNDAAASAGAVAEAGAAGDAEMAADAESGADATGGAASGPDTAAIAGSGANATAAKGEGESPHFIPRGARSSLFPPSKKGGPDFWQIYGLILGLLLVAVGGGLGYLWRNLTAYEASMPDYVLSQYSSPAIQGGLPKLFAHEAALPGKYESSQVKDKFIRSLLSQGELEYRRSASQSKEGKELYLFKAGQETLAVLALEKVHQGPFGYWQAADIELRLPVYGELRLYVPEGTQVTVNGNPLDEGDRINQGLPYEELQALPQDLIEMPKQSEYLLTGLYNQPVIEAMGPYGNELAVKWRETEEGKAAAIIPLAPPEDLPAIEEMILADIRIYSNYTSRDAAFSSLARRLIRNAKIYKEMQTLETIYYTDHTGFSFNDEKVHYVRLYSSDCLAAHTNYIYTIIRANGQTHPLDTALTFYYLRINGQWMIADIAQQKE